MPNPSSGAVKSTLPGPGEGSSILDVDLVVMTAAVCGLVQDGGESAACSAMPVSVARDPPPSVVRGSNVEPSVRGTRMQPPRIFIGI